MVQKAFADLLGRLSSRTFWVAVGTIITLIANEQWGEAASVAAAYILGEKGLDAVQTAKGQKVVVSSTPAVDDSSVDTSEVVTGTLRQRRTDEIDE